MRIHGWELDAVPALLQTEDYIRSLIRSGHPMDSGDDIDRLVAARLERQEIVASPTPPLLWYVLDESVLGHVVGGAAVMRRQLDRLLDVGKVLARDPRARTFRILISLPTIFSENLRFVPRK